MRTFLFCAFLWVFCQSYSQISDFEHIDFSKADQNALVLKGNSLKDLPVLVKDLTQNLDTDVERFRAIYKWVCTNIENDYRLFYKNERKRRKYSEDSLKLENWNEAFSKQVFKKLLKKKKTLCSGYAYLIQKMASYTQIKCEVINGFARTSTTNVENLNLPNHAWNAVLLNDKWYFCDPTWSSGKQHPEYGRFIFEYTDGFFLADPRLFNVNHFPVEERWQTLDSTKLSYEDFIESPILYNATYTYLNAVNAPLKSYLEIEKNTKTQFSFELKKPVETNAVKLRIINGASDKRVTPKQIRILDNQLQFHHEFTRTGWYDVHVYLEETPILSLAVKVKRQL